MDQGGTRDARRSGASAPENERPERVSSDTKVDAASGREKRDVGRAPQRPPATAAALGAEEAGVGGTNAGFMLGGSGNEADPSQSAYRMWSVGSVGKTEEEVDRVQKQAKSTMEERSETEVVLAAGTSTGSLDGEGGVRRGRDVEAACKSWGHPAFVHLCVTCTSRIGSCPISDHPLRQCTSRSCERSVSEGGECSKRFHSPASLPLMSWLAAQVSWGGTRQRGCTATHSTTALQRVRRGGGHSLRGVGACAFMRVISPLSGTLSALIVRCPPPL